MKIFLIILLLVLFLFCLAVLIASFVIYKMAFYSPDKHQNEPYHIPHTPQYDQSRELMTKLISELEAIPFEQVYITSKDGLVLAGRFYNVKENAPVDICFHGWRGNCSRDFCGGIKISLEMEHNVLLIDERGQGISQGHTMTFGVKERYDALEWIKFIIEKCGKNTEINLIGVSMGAATVVMCAGLELPSNVKHIVADAPYSSPSKILKKVIGQDMKLPLKLCWPLVLTAAGLYGHFNLSDKTAVAARAAANTNIPILIIHGEEDLFVPCYMSEEIAVANPLIKREIFPKAGHCLSYMVDTERYTKIVKEFLK